ASPDGKTVYCAAGGKIWALPTSGGEPRLIRVGDAVAADPTGKYLVVSVIEALVMRLIRVPLDGGPEQPISIADGQRPAFLLSSNAIGKDGRIVIPMGSTTWYWPPGVLDPSTGKFTRIPVDYDTDYHVMGWAP